MRILTTFPGRAGDLCWALPSIRAISETLGTPAAPIPVDLQICGEFEGMLPLLTLQPYLRKVWADPRWSMADGWQAPSSAGPYARGAYDRVFDLGYRRWPELPLPFEVEQTAWREWQAAGLPAPGPIPDLTRPWLVAPPAGDILEIAVGFTECWFELKLGLLYSLDVQLREFLTVLTPAGTRWTTEVPGETTLEVRPCGWLEAAGLLASAEVVLADCSALHVLAVALGKPVVVVEPMQERLNPIFWPLGMDGLVQVVKGNDGLPSFDARHCAETLQTVLGRVR